MNRLLTFEPDGSPVAVSAILDCPPDARWLYVLAHGAGAGIRHAFMESVSARLNDRGVATFRYQFPYMEQDRRRPDSARLLKTTVKAAVERAAGEVPGLPLFAGGKSMGGRMTSLAQSTERLPGVGGIVFLGFPLHQPGKPSEDRAQHLGDISLPMLFVQGTRDSLADIGLIEQVCSRLGDRADLRVVDGGDHSFKVLKRSGRTVEDVIGEIADAVVQWLETKETMVR